MDCGEMGDSIKGGVRYPRVDFGSGGGSPSDDSSPHSPMKHPLIRASALLPTLLAAHFSEAAPTYALTDLGPGSARGINSAGKVVGQGPMLAWYFNGVSRVDLNFQQNAFNQPGLVYALPVPVATAINDSDTMVGAAVQMPLFPGGMGPTLYPYIYSGGPSGILFPSVAQGSLESINASGVAVGGRGSSAFIFDGTKISRFASAGAVPLAINASGVVAGYNIGPSGPEARAARFVGGATAILDLSAVPNPSGQGPWSEARGINANGAIVGFIRTQRNLPLDPIQGFVHSNGQATDIGGLGGFQTMAYAINDSGVIVGTSDTTADVAHAFVRVGSEMIDLNSAVTAGGQGWVLVSAYAINASGCIVGEGIKDGVQRAFLLRPTPTISRQPVGTNVTAGNPFTLSVQASGLAPFTYQWRHAGTNLPGATSDALGIPKATAVDAGSYQVIVSNVAGDTASAEVVVEVNLRPELTIRTYAGLTVTGVAGRTYRIDASNNPQGPWAPVGTLKLESSEAFWLDHQSPQNPQRVYRAVEVP